MAKQNTARIRARDQGQDTPEPLLSFSEEQLRAFNHLVSTLYRCLNDNEGFRPFFDAFQAHFHALQGGILGITNHPRRLIYGWTFGYPDGFEEWFINSDLPERDEALARYSELPPRRFESFLQDAPDRSILTMLGPESRAWAEAVGMGDSAGMLAKQDNDSKVIFMANRHQRFGPYSRQDLLQMNLLAPHIETAITLHFKLYESRSDNESLAMALDQVNKPLIVFNALAAVSQANGAARDLLALSETLSIGEERRLRARDRRLDRRLSSAITTCLIQANKGTPEPHTLFINNREERLAVCLTPLMASTPGNNGVLAELFRYDINMEPDLKRLRTLFPCTPTEARIAGDLIHGLNAGEIAAKRSLSVHTARQHIKNLLAKNGYRKQTELVAMLVRALA